MALSDTEILAWVNNGNDDGYSADDIEFFLRLSRSHDEDIKATLARFRTLFVSVMDSELPEDIPNRYNVATAATVFVVRYKIAPVLIISLELSKLGITSELLAASFTNSDKLFDLATEVALDEFMDDGSNISAILSEEEAELEEVIVDTQEALTKAIKPWLEARDQIQELTASNSVGHDVTAQLSQILTDLFATLAQYLGETHEDSVSAGQSHPSPMT